MIQSIEPGRNGTSPEPAELNHISPSSVKLYLSCSLKYYFKKILQLPEPASPALQLGKAVHAGLQAFHLGRWRRESHDLQTVLGAFEKSLQEGETEQPVNYHPGERDQVIASGKRLLNTYLSSAHAQMQELPLGVEVKLEADVDILPSPLLGFIDLVLPGNVPVDYKTCASTPNPEAEAFLHELQMTLYQILIEESTGERVDGRELVFLVKTKTPKVLAHRMPPATQREKQRALDISMAAIDGIYHERFHPQPGMHCNWCAFRAECSQWTGGAS